MTDENGFAWISCFTILSVQKMSNVVWHGNKTSKNKQTNKQQIKRVFWESFPLVPGGRNNF